MPRPNVADEKPDPDIDRPVRDVLREHRSTIRFLTWFFGIFVFVHMMATCEDRARIIKLEKAITPNEATK